MPTITWIRGGVLAAVALAAACSGGSESAFNEAVEFEAGLPKARAVEAVPAYEKVVALDPQGEWGKLAAARIRSLQHEAAKADETHKNVFQEHGVD